ncbi:hypothetical protein ACLESO_21510 [Pyxidicoccus sp. 3LG]
MADPSPDIYRSRLEGRAELLEAARSRYRELLEVLRAPWWEERLRGGMGTLRVTGEELTRADAALAMALRRARAEAWPEKSPTVRLLHEVQSLRDTFFRVAVERLGADAPSGAAVDASVLTRALEEHARCVPRRVAPASRWNVAQEVLPEDLPLLREVAAFGALLRACFSAPFDSFRPLPLQATELEALKRQWPEGVAALDECWSRLFRVDPTGGVEDEVRRRSGREQLQAPRSGPEQLASADYWFQTAVTRLDGLRGERLSCLRPTPPEWLDVVFWLCERGRESLARLRAPASLAEPRAALFELAYELWEALHSGLPEAERWPEDRWERMLDCARRAEPLARGMESASVRQALRAFILSRSVGTSRLRGWSEKDSLEALLSWARELVRSDGPR